MKYPETFAHKTLMSGDIAWNEKECTFIVQFSFGVKEKQLEKMNWADYNM